MGWKPLAGNIVTIFDHIGDGLGEPLVQRASP